MNHSETTQSPVQEPSEVGAMGGIYYVWAIKDKVGERDVLPTNGAQLRPLVEQNRRRSHLTDLSFGLKNTNHKINHLQLMIKYIPVYSCFLHILYNSSKPVIVIC